MLKLSKTFPIFLTLILTCSSCALFKKDIPDPVLPDDPTIIVVPDSSVPKKVEAGEIIAWPCYFVNNFQLLELMDGKWVEYKKEFKKMDVCESNGYVLHVDIVEKKRKQIKLKDE